MTKLTVLMLVLVAGAVRADRGAALLPSAEFSVRLAEADHKLEAVEGRQSSARWLRGVGAVSLTLSAATLVWGVLEASKGISFFGAGNEPLSTAAAALLITSVVTLLAGVAAFGAAIDVSPSDAEIAAVSAEHDRLHAFGEQHAGDVAAPAEGVPTADGAPLSAPPLPAP